MTTAYLAIQMQMPLVNIMEHRFRLGISTIREHSSVDNFLSKMVKLKKTLNCKEQAALGWQFSTRSYWAIWSMIKTSFYSLKLMRWYYRTLESREWMKILAIGDRDEDHV